MRQTIEPILDLLDEGLRLYRRSFAPLLLLASLAALPLGATAAAFFLAADWLADGLGALLLGAVLILGLPLTFYVMGALSRAALMAADGQPVNLRRALAIGPLRALGMGCYGVLFSIVASVAVSTVSTACLCIAYLGAAAVIGGALALGSAGGAAGGAAAVFFVALGVIVFLVIYGASLVLNGAIYGSVVYALQPLIHEGGRLGAGIRRSIDLLQFRFGANLLAFICASLVFSAAALAATIAIGALIPLPALFLLGTESNVARAITAAAWVTGLSAAVPLLPIWMALLYRRRVAAREGEDLAARIAALRPAEST
jgi:hypothetical protein